LGHPVYRSDNVVSAENASIESCPMSGIHHSASSSDGCLHRLNVGCNGSASILVDSSCSQRRQYNTVQTYQFCCCSRLGRASQRNRASLRGVPRLWRFNLRTPGRRNHRIGIKQKANSIKSNNNNIQ